MGRDLVIYDKNTRVIYGIITDIILSDESKSVLNGQLQVIQVDSNSPYITVDNDGIMKLKSTNSKILYLDDYRQRD